MLLISLLAAVAMLLLSRFRIWLLYAFGGAAFAVVLSVLSIVMARLLPDGVKVFAAVLSFLLLNGGLFWLTSLPVGGHNAADMQKSDGNPWY